MAGNIGGAKVAGGDKSQILVQSIPAHGLWELALGIIEPDRIGAGIGLAIDGDSLNETMG